MHLEQHSAWLVILLGIASTTQAHLAKALERQGIEALDQLRSRLAGRDAPREGRAHMPAIYLTGVLLNHTTFLYHLAIAPLRGTAALYTGMYGVGLVALLAYTTQVMKEPLARRELLGAAAILAGTVAIGLEGLARPALDMAAVDLGQVVAALLVLLAVGAGLVLAGLRAGTPNWIGLTFGLTAGTFGCLDPFLKAASQSAGGGQFAPQSTLGWTLLVSSFLIGEVAFLTSQWGFYRRARAGILVPALNCSYVAVPVVLQRLLLPGYVAGWPTLLGLAAIMAGIVLLSGRRAMAPRKAAPQSCAEEPDHRPA